MKFLARAALGLFLAASVASALEAHVSIHSPDLKNLSGLRTVLLHTGNAALDDALEEGFRQHWKLTRWSWAADTGFPKIASDSSILVFGNFPLYRWRVRGLFGCFDGWQERKGLCYQNDSAGSFSLYKLTGTRQEELLSEISELRSWPRGDAMAVDVVRDFHTVLARLEADSLADDALFSSNAIWPGLIASFPRREACPSCTVWVAREYDRSFDAAQASRLLELPVRTIGMDSLDGMLGTGRKGLYLDAGSRSNFAQNLHLRTLDSGVLVATHTEFDNQGNDRIKGLDADDLAPLAHRLKGEEKRVVVSVSWFVQMSENTLVSMGLVGIEFARGWHGLLGYGSGRSLLNTSADESIDQLLVGVRWYPLLGYEARALASRVVMDLTLLQPLGTPTKAPTDYWDYSTWNAPTTLGLQFTTNASIFELGVGWQLPLGDEFSGGRSANSSERPDKANWNLRLGIRTEWRGWRKAPSLFTDRRTPSSEQPSSRTPDSSSP